MSKKFLCPLAILAATGFLGIQTACAAVITILDATQGWIESDGHNNSTFPNNNYIVGNCDNTDCGNGGGYRDFFGFAIPDLSGQTVTSAVLAIYTSGTSLDQSPSLTVGFASLAAVPASYAALGTGTPYGSFTYTSLNALQTEDIPLDDAALSAIESDQGSLFFLGGRVTSPVSFGGTEPDQWVYGSTIMQQQLILTTGSRGGVPEPGTLALFAAALTGFGIIRTRRQGAARGV